MLTFLGSGGAFNTKRGNTSAYTIIGEELFLFDVGEDVFAKLVKKGLLHSVCKVNIFITHLHGDHVGSLGTLIAYLYYKVFHQESANICLYFPSMSIVEFLRIQGVSTNWYQFFINRWDELYLPGLRKQPEYAFLDTVHTEKLDYNAASNCYSIEFELPGEFSFFYSGDTNSFHEKLHNLCNYDFVYHEVTMVKEARVHFQYDKLLEETSSFSLEEKGKIYLMHLDDNFDEERAIKDGFQIVTNCD